MDGAIVSPAQTVLGSLSRLGAALADPFSTFDRQHWALAQFSPAEIESLASAPAFRGPLRRALTRSLTAGLANLTRDEFLRLGGSRQGRLAVSLLAAPMGDIVDTALLCAAAAFHLEILAAAGRAERAVLRRALGAEAWLLATQEARGLYPTLSKLADPAYFRHVMAQADGDEVQRQFVRYGIGLLLQIVRPVAPELAELVARRLPADIAPPEASAAGHGDVERLLRLIDRRRPEWLATIG